MMRHAFVNGGRAVVLVAAVSVLAGCGPEQMPVAPPTSTTTSTTSTTTAGPVVPKPDSRLTPGQVGTTDLQIVCHTSTATRRHVTAATRAQVFAAYKITGSHAGYELDHLIPLELGGSNDAANLWPQPAPGYGEKDKVENRLHVLVCAGKLDLAAAQHAIATDWQAAAVAYP